MPSGKKSQQIGIRQGGLGGGGSQPGVEIITAVFDLLGPELGAPGQGAGQAGEQSAGGHRQLYPAA